MADRYQDRPFPSDGYGRGGDQHGPGRADSDPLAELARLIGQTDPFGSQGRAPARPATAPQQQYQPPAQSYPPDSYEDSYEDSYQEPAPPPPPGPPAWMRRANVQAPAVSPPQQDYPAAVSPVHPLHRYAPQQPAAEPEHYQPEHYQPDAYQEAEEQPDPARYDDALYGQLEAGEQDFQRDPAYPDDPYAYQNDYPEDVPDEAPKRRGGMLTVAAILTLAVVGTGGAFAYRTFVGSARNSEPPIIKADNTPIKVVPAPADGAPKVPDRMATGDGSEKIVPREEAPIDINAKSGGPRVVFPPLNPNNNPPPVASVAPSAVPPPAAGPVPSNGTLPNNEPRRIRTFSVKGDQPDGTAPQATVAPAPAKPGPAARTAPAPRNSPSSANASANAPLSLTPQGGPSSPAAPVQRMAATNPTQIAPAASAAASSGTGGYLVQVSSQRSESDASASYRALQNKFPSVLGSHSLVIKRADLGDKGVYYRAMVGPFASSEEAGQFCGNLKSAGGQCVVQRN